MEKQAVIQELHRLQGLWNQIVPLTEKSVKVAFRKGDAEDRRKAESEKKYRYDPKIKIANELSTYNAAQVEGEISYRHKQDCLKAAKKKLSAARVLLVIATIVGILIAVAPHALNIVGNKLEVYDSFTGSIGFTLREDMAEYQSVISLVLAVFAAGSQALTVLLVGLAALSIIKGKACSRVPELGKAHTGLFIAATVVLGIFGVFTWIVVNPVGLLSLVPAIVLLPILQSGAAKLADSRIPVATAEEAARLEKAKAEDAKNHEENEAARRAANAREKKAFEARQKKALADYEKEIAAYDRDIEQLTDDIAAMMKQAKSETLSDKDNNLNTVNRLLDYLENGRADTLKEALYMVDMEKEREKDRETQRKIAQMKLENDRYIAEQERRETRRYNDQMLAQQRDHNERMQRELDRHNAQVEREQEAHNREMKQELDRLKSKMDL